MNRANRKLLEGNRITIAARIFQNGPIDGWPERDGLLRTSRLRTAVVRLSCLSQTLLTFGDSREQRLDPLPMPQLSLSVDVKSRPVTISLRHLRLRLPVRCFDEGWRPGWPQGSGKPVAAQYTLAATQPLNAV